MRVCELRFPRQMTLKREIVKLPNILLEKGFLWMNDARRQRFSEKNGETTKNRLSHHQFQFQSLISLPSLLGLGPWRIIYWIRWRGGGKVEGNFKISLYCDSMLSKHAFVTYSPCLLTIGEEEREARLSEASLSGVLPRRTSSQLKIYFYWELKLSSSLSSWFMNVLVAFSPSPGAPFQCEGGGRRFLKRQWRNVSECLFKERLVVE